MKTQIIIYIFAAATLSVVARGFNSKDSGFKVKSSVGRGSSPSASTARSFTRSNSQDSNRRYSGSVVQARSAAERYSAPSVKSGSYSQPVTARSAHSSSGPTIRTPSTYTAPQTPNWKASAGNKPVVTIPAVTRNPVVTRTPSTYTAPQTPNWKASAGKKPVVTSPAASQPAPRHDSTRTTYRDLQTTTPRTTRIIPGPATPSRRSGDPLTSRAAEPESARFSRRVTKTTQTITVPEGESRLTPESTGRAQPKSRWFNPSSPAQPAPSTKIRTPQSELPGTILSRIPAKFTSASRGTRSDNASRYLSNAKSPLRPSIQSKDYRRAVLSPGNRIPVRKPASLNSHAVSLSRYSTRASRHISTAPAYYRRPGGKYNNHHNRYTQRDRHHYNNRYHNCFTPVWRGPVVYPSCHSYGYGYSSGFGIGFSWSWGSAYISSASFYTPYYNSAYYGGWGYSSVYYGGWRSGWYGGLSYACNPTPVYRTYYLYEPEPIIIEQPVVIRQEYVAAREPPPQILESEIPVLEPAAQVTQYAPGSIVIEEHAAIREASQELGAPAAEIPTGFDPEYFYPDQFDALYYSGVEPEDEFELGFFSYAASLNPENIWISYAGLDRWDY